MAKCTGMTELKAHLSRILQQVKEGEEIVITKRNIPLARIVPIPAAADEQMEALERQGLIKRGTGRLPKDFWNRPRGSDSKARARAAVGNEREEG